MSDALAQLREGNHPKAAPFCPHLRLSPISHPAPLAGAPGITNLQMNPGTVAFWRRRSTALATEAPMLGYPPQKTRRRMLLFAQCFPRTPLELLPAEHKPVGNALPGRNHATSIPWEGGTRGGGLRVLSTAVGKHSTCSLPASFPPILQQHRKTCWQSLASPWKAPGCQPSFQIQLSRNPRSGCELEGTPESWSRIPFSL